MKQKFPTKPMLLGVWEKELSFIWDSLENHEFIIDVGAAEGFYAVGLARKYPNKKIIAFEMNPTSKILLEKTIKDNSVKNLEVFGKCEYQDLSKIYNKLRNSFIIMDCEGHELELLKNSEPSIFKKTHILVELHEMYAVGCTNILKRRFADTHQVSEIEGQHRSLSDWPSELSFLRFLFPQKLLLHFMDEGRPHPMNWLYMKPKSS
ncbi:hypothetical protein OAU80_02395 [Opitutales bacterium]|nr:hypothetical protein [Opitutales bacterium]